MKKQPYEIPWATALRLDLNESTLVVGSSTGEPYDDQIPYDDGFDE